MAQAPRNPHTIHFATGHLYRSSDKGQTVVPASQIFETNIPTPRHLPQIPPVSASGISPQNDHMPSLGSAAGMFSGRPLALRCSLKSHSPRRDSSIEEEMFETIAIRKTCR